MRLVVCLSILFSMLTSCTHTALFDIAHRPPELINPTKIVLPENDALADIVQYGACGFGKVYSLKFAENEDALITFNGKTPLAYPVHVTGGRNVIIRGLEIVIETQPGNEAGTLTLNSQKYNKTNPHPIIPACGGLRLSVKKATHWVEGLYLDMNGHDADAIIVNGSNIPGNSKVVIQNSLIEGVEGSQDIHGDILQTQSGHLKDLIFENVTMRQALEGIVLSFPVDNVEMRNVDYGSDSRFDSDDKWDDKVIGGFFAGKAVKTFSFENIYIKYKNPETDLWFLIGKKHFTSSTRAGQVVYGITTEYNPEIHFKQSPPKGNYVLKSQVGKKY